MENYWMVGGLGLVAGFLSGLLGIGGGIVSAPLLLYIPPLFGLDHLPIKVVAGLTITQGLVSSLSGVFVHRQAGSVSKRLSMVMGVTIFVTALAGGAASHIVPNEVLLFILAWLAMAAAILILKPSAGEEEFPLARDIDFSRVRAVLVSAGVGLFGGMVGQGGSFLLIPLMVAYIKIPTRVAIGSNLAIVFLSSLAGFIGKALTGQIDWGLAAAMTVAVVPATRVGAVMSRRIPVLRLRQALAAVIVAAAIRMGVSIFL